MRLLRLLATLILRPFQFLIYGLAGLVPRNPSRWAAGTWSGQRFADNTAAVFLHCQEQAPPDVEIAWITARRTIRNDLRDQGYRSMTRWSPSGVLWCLRSGVFVYDSLPSDVNYWLSNRAKLVLLRHGIGVKKVERAIDAPDHRLFKLFHGSRFQRIVYGAVLPWHRDVPDMVTACSSEHADQAIEYFGVDRFAIRMTGFPRHDRLASPGPRRRGELPTKGKPVPGDRPVFLYLPTFRESILPQRFDWRTLEVAAEVADVTVAVKLHLVDATRGVRGLDVIESSDRICLLDPSADPIDLYPNSDGLITDFSSVAFDYLLVDRPIIYFVPDLDDFMDSRPLVYRLGDVAAGPICSDESSLAQAVKRAVANPSADAPLRRMRKERFHQVPIGGASQRVVDAIVALTTGTGYSPELRVPEVPAHLRAARDHRAS